MKRIRWGVPILVLALVVIAGCGSGAATVAPATTVATVPPTVGGSSTSAATLPSGAPTAAAAATATALPGKALVNERCTACHSLDRIQASHMTEAGWTTTVTRMIGNGARLSAAEKAAVIQHLAATYK